MGYVRTASDRRVWLNLYGWQWDRNAINAPIQGSAADHTKLTLGMIHRMCANAGVPFDLILVVHDEVVLDVTRGTMQDQRRIVESAWIEAGKKLAPDVPMVVDIATGFHWGVKS
jgi:DNA polymerase-1